MSSFSNVRICCFLLFDITVNWTYFDYIMDKTLSHWALIHITVFICGTVLNTVIYNGIHPIFNQTLIQWKQWGAGWTSLSAWGVTEVFLSPCLRFQTHGRAIILWLTQLSLPVGMWMCFLTWRHAGTCQAFPIESLMARHTHTHTHTHTVAWQQPSTPSGYQ